MIAAGRAGSPEVTAAADPVIMKLAMAGYGNEAVWLLRDSLVPSSRATWDAVRGLTEFGRRKYLRWHRATVDSLVSSLLQFDVTLRTRYGVHADALHREIANTILWRRNFALRFERLGQRLARQDPARRAKIAAFHGFRREYGMWTMYLPANGEATASRTKVFAEEVWRTPEYDELWQDAYGDLTYDSYVHEFGEPSVVDVVEALPPRTWLLEYWWYVRSTDAGQAREYLVMRLGTEPEPTIPRAKLGSAATIDDLVARIVASASGRGVRGRLGREAPVAEQPTSADSFVQLCGELRAAVIDPFNVLTPDVSQLIIVPDGPLGRASFAAMPTGPDSYLLDTHNVSYAESGADLVRDNVRPSDATRCAAPLVLGAPDFDSSLTGDLAARLWTRLPGAELEAAAVGAHLGVEPLTGDDATVDSLLGVHSPRILHVATHGGMLPAKRRAATFDPLMPELTDALIDATATYVYEHPGFLDGRGVPYQELRSVIALAGANTWLATGIIDDDKGTGHANAEDILDVDLEDTQLVVLSACDVGWGILHVDEGVVGLRSSLRLAGARATVCALWPVPDLATADLMTAFYRELDLDAVSESLRQAQLRIREQHPTDPLMWAAFTCATNVPG